MILLVFVCVLWFDLDLFGLCDCLCSFVGLIGDCFFAWVLVFILFVFTVVVWWETFFVGLLCLFNFFGYGLGLLVFISVVV